MTYYTCDKKMNILHTTSEHLVPDWNHVI